MSAYEPYNPLEKRNLGASVAEALLGRQAHPLGNLPKFEGAGIYALYYAGPFRAYRRLAELNEGPDPQIPIYVGKAIPAGGRKGLPRDDNKPGRSLVNRLSEHAESIQAVSNLDLADFKCRFLCVDDIWIPLGESLLIAKFSPLWNIFVDGFGNHDPGKGRHAGMVSRWDALHQGRAWATKCQPRPETAEQIAVDIEARLAQEPALLRPRFLAEQKSGSYTVDRTAQP